MAPLTGGQKDVTPPKLLKAVPENGSVNFHFKTIELDFNEYVQVKDLINQLVVTPQTKEIPFVEARGKKLIVKFNEELMPNTTYRLFFGQAISDMHESNVVSNYEYVFSTGSLIDSLSVIGEVVNSFNLKPEEDITVGLYPEKENDSIIYSQKPLYFTKTVNNGKYELNNLPHARYKLVAFSDKNKNRMFDGGEEMIGFLGETIETGLDSSVNLRISRESTKKQFLKKAYSPYYGLAYVIYNAEQTNRVKVLNAEQDNICSTNALNDTCFVFYKNIFDTLKMIIEHEADHKPDSLSISVYSKEKFEKQVAEKKLSLGVSLTPQINGSMPYFEFPGLFFTTDIESKTTDTSKIVFTSLKDTIKSSVPLNFSRTGCNALQFNRKLIQETEYELIIRKGAFKNAFGIENDSVKFTFKTNSDEDYASLALKLWLPGKENYMIQLLNENNEIVEEKYIEQSIASSTEYSIKFMNLKPGNYFVKSFEDKNKNRNWDPGRYHDKQQAENVYINPISIKLLANWDSEAEWTVK